MTSSFKPSLPNQLAWMDRLSTLAPPADQERVRTVHALREMAEGQGLAVSQAQAERAWEELASPPPMPLWRRPATAADWEGLKAALDTSLEAYQTATRRRIRGGWAALTGAWLGITALWSAQLGFHAAHGGSVFLTLALLSALPWLAVGRAYHHRGVPRYRNHRRFREAVLEGQRALLNPAYLDLDLARQAAEVPGLAACLRAIRASEVPYLQADASEVRACLRAFRAQQAEHARQQKIVADHQAIDAILAQGQ